MPAAIVVGAGAFGASLADRLVAEGWEVTLIDRFGPGDPRAESGGETRLLRFSHGGDALYTRLARRAREHWLELGGVLEECGRGLARARPGRLGGRQRARAARRGRAGGDAWTRPTPRACSRASPPRGSTTFSTSPRPGCCGRPRA